MKMNKMDCLNLIQDTDPDGLWEALCREYRAENVQFDHIHDGYVSESHVVLIITESDIRNYTVTVDISEIVGIYNRYQMLLDLYSEL